MKLRGFRWIAAWLTLGGALAASSAQAECTAGPPLAGVAESTPSADFAVLPGGFAVNLKTRLIWKRCAEGQTWDGTTCTGSAQAFTWGEALNQSVAATDGGSSEWRVPNRKELESIAEFCGHSPTINQTVFPNTPHERFWTSTTFVAEPNRAWSVNFSDGYVGASYKTAAPYVRLVRSLAAGDLPLGQTISFVPVPALAVGGNATVTATASSGLPVTLSSATGSVCTISGTTVSALRTGVCVVNADQAGDATFAAAPAASLSIAIAGAGQVISFGTVPVLTVGGSGTVTASASSGLPVALSTLTPSTCSLTGTTLRGLAVGSCSIAADQAGNELYAPAPQSRQDIPVSASTSTGGGDPPPPPPQRVTLNLVAGWNLVGNGSDAAFDTEDLFGQNDQVESLWKWVVKGKGVGVKYPAWAFSTPALRDKGRAFAAGKGYEWLSTVNPGEAFWVQARSAFSVTLPGAPLPASAFTPAGVPGMPGGGSLALDRGWSLIATGEDLSPEQFHAAVGGAASKLVSLWAWDASTSKWLFYAPELQQKGGAVLRDYANQRGYRDFLQNGKRLLPATGFWVHRK
jgi:hypothetical protein